MLDAAEAIYMLNNCMDSDGARLEGDYAAYQGKRIFYEFAESDRKALFWLYDKDDKAKGEQEDV